MVHWPSSSPKDLVLVVLLLFPWWVVLWYQTRRAIGYPDAQDCLSVKQKPIREQPGRASYPERGKQGELMIYQDSDRNPTIVKMYRWPSQGPCSYGPSRWWNETITISWCVVHYSTLAALRSWLRLVSGIALAKTGRTVDGFITEYKRA